MAKILITSIGTGLNDKKDISKGYRETNYYSDTQMNYETPYIFEALKNFNGIDKCIFIGTCGSDWFSLYEYLFNKDSLYDEEYATQLLTLFEGFENKIPNEDDLIKTNMILEKLKLCMGDFCKEIILLKYGLNNAEHIENFGLLSTLVDYIDENDEIYFDITHSFRSLPMYEFLTIEYLKATRQKNFKIGLISYGMFEVSKANNNKTPIVDMTQIVDILEWIKAVEEFNKFGTAYLLQELLDKSPDMFDLSKEERKMFRFLGDAISVNQTKDFKKLVEGCYKLNKNDCSKVINSVVAQIFKDISDRFSECTNDEILLLFELALWNLEKKRYLNGAVIAVESVLFYIEQLTGKSRDYLRDAVVKIKVQSDIVRNFLNLYNSIRKTRNNLCHMNLISQTELDKFIEDIKGLRTIYKNRFKDNDVSQNALKDAFLNKK